MIMFSFGTECKIIGLRTILSKCLIFPFLPLYATFSDPNVYKCLYSWTQFPTSLVLMIPMHMIALILVSGPFSRGHKRCYASTHAYAYVGPVFTGDRRCYAFANAYAYVVHVFTEHKRSDAATHANTYVGPVFTRH